ncbi:MAG TPA: hypothetical protein VLA56_15015 [Pseudomonadales bacterium]|nr:hypothetical protein [Pseudomonadales bacterium]
MFDDYDGVPCVASFNTDSERQGPELVDLSPLGLLHIEGPDAAKFLQGYATCDVNRVSASRSAPSALCTREGRTLATFRLWGEADALTLRLHRALIVPVHDLLARFIVFSKADLVEAGDRRLGMGLCGDGGEALIADLCGRAPNEDEILTTTTDAGDLTVIRCRGLPERFELWMDTDAAPAIWTRLEAGARPVPYARWVAHRIRAGYVELSPRTAGEFVPQALNLQAVGSISFDKGCYLGQEVVARMQYLGRIKKRLYRFSLDASHGHEPVLGADVTVDGEDGEVVGEVVAAATDGDRCELLAVVRNDRIDARLYAGRHPLVFEDLPYDVPAPRAAGGG